MTVDVDWSWRRRCEAITEATGANSPHLISECPAVVMPPSQSLIASDRYMEAGKVAQSCRPLRSQGAFLYYAAADRPVDSQTVKIMSPICVDCLRTGVPIVCLLEQRCACLIAKLFECLIMTKQLKSVLTPL